MRKLSYYLTLISTVVIGVVSCSKEDANNKFYSDGTVVYAAINQLDTKVDFVDNEEEGIDLNWKL